MAAAAEDEEEERRGGGGGLKSVDAGSVGRLPFREVPKHISFLLFPSFFPFLFLSCFVFDVLLRVCSFRLVGRLGGSSGGGDEM